ncbi:MFS transporter [Nocardioides cynanchi]|uniref:MFS transporter n=1 Tax=Nocardioides cynanchi TaxID=2558918 RepID=UPI001244BEE6|nr:MFS transporter [Nocardioides cynanchi]
MRQAFHRPGFPRLYLGLTTSMFGDSVMLLVLSVWVKTLTGSNAQAGLTFLFLAVSALFAPLMGLGIDRVRRKPLLVWGHLASGVLVLPLLLVHGAGQVWIIWAVAAGYGVSFIALPAALNGLLKELMPDEMLVDANASLQTTKESFRLVGPLIGALLFTWVGGWVVALLDAATFFAAALVISTLTLSEAPPERETTQFWTQMTAGLRHLATDRVLKHVLVGFAMCILVIGFTESAIYALLDAFDRPPTFVSVIVSVQGVGAIVGGLSSSAVVKRLGEVASCVVGLLVLVVGILIMAWTHSIVVVCLSAAVFGASLPLITVALMTLIQRRTPQAVMGRVSAAIEVVMGTPQAVSLAIGSLLVLVLSYRQIFTIMGVVTLLAAAYIAVLLRRQIVDDVRRPADAGPDAVRHEEALTDAAVLPSGTLEP